MLDGHAQNSHICHGHSEHQDHGDYKVRLNKADLLQGRQNDNPNERAGGKQLAMGEVDQLDDASQK